MNFKDQWATNEDGEKFVFTVEMQRKLAEQGLPVEPDSLAELDDVTPVVADNSNQNGHQNQSNGNDGHQQKESKSDDKESFEEPAAIQIDPQTGKYIGRVKWYNVSKGYGFISRGGGEDIFFHKTDTICDTNTLDEGVWILYDVEETSKGLEASEVELYKGAE